MNKLLKVFAMTLMLVLGGQAMAQTHGTMFLGASFPMGDFCKVNNLSSTALWGNDQQTFGGAGIGFNAGLKWDFGIGIPGLAVVLSVDGLYNGPSADIKQCYKDRVNLTDYLNNEVDQTTPKYINVPAMLGMRYTFYLTPQLAIYAEGAAGGNARFITDYTMKYTDLLSVKHTDTERYSTAFTFAYQAGLGIEVSKNLVIGCSFYDLGGAVVKGEGTYKPSTTSGKYDINRGTLKPVMLLGRIGFRF